MRIHSILTAAALAAGLAVSQPAAAQEGRAKEHQKDQGRGGARAGTMGPRGEEMGRRGPVGQDLMQYLYPIDLIRHYSTDIKLTGEQIKKIHKLMSEASDEVERLKWDMEKEAQKLVDLVKAGEPKNKIYSQMDRIFSIENKIKKKHLGLMIEVRDVLTASQREALDKVKAESADQPVPFGDALAPPPMGMPRPPSMPNPPPPPPGR